MSTLPEHRRFGAYEDRCQECQQALEPIFDNVTRMALACGWNEDDVAYALLEFARLNIKGLTSARVVERECRVPAMTSRTA